MTQGDKKNTNEGIPDPNQTLNANIKNTTEIMTTRKKEITKK